MSAYRTPPWRSSDDPAEYERFAKNLRVVPRAAKVHALVFSALFVILGIQGVATEGVWSEGLIVLAMGLIYGVVAARARTAPSS